MPTKTDVVLAMLIKGMENSHNGKQRLQLARQAMRGRKVPAFTAGGGATESAAFATGGGETEPVASVAIPVSTKTAARVVSNFTAVAVAAGQATSTASSGGERLTSSSAATEPTVFATSSGGQILTSSSSVSASANAVSGFVPDATTMLSTSTASAAAADPTTVSVCISGSDTAQPGALCMFRVRAAESAAVVTGAADQNKPHTCSLCSKSFATGQALGGHMRAHYEGNKQQATAENRLMAGPSSSLTECSTAKGLRIDLNQPAMPEAEWAKEEEATDLRSIDSVDSMVFWVLSVGGDLRFGDQLTNVVDRTNEPGDWPHESMSYSMFLEPLAMCFLHLCCFTPTLIKNNSSSEKSQTGNGELTQREVTVAIVKADHEIVDDNHEEEDEGEQEDGESRLSGDGESGVLGEETTGKKDGGEEKEASIEVILVSADGATTFSGGSEFHHGKVNGSTDVRCAVRERA
ncbi:hypothetical protein ZIOFF_048240 [Zingiber officinale]|uniref:C2H2-type domain-containing protein n=1 Tax=Zingiber officinale TaxID=94328 RepID=A0A8J5KS20_ZINOF|nr:hypothetical protein ZIOFF_048240 [Zingiber officinale]